MTLLLLAAGPAPLSAASAIEEVAVGFGGVFQVGRWTPVRVQAKDWQEGGDEAVVIASDPDGRPVEYPLEVDASGRGVGVFVSGRLEAPVRIVVSGPDGSVQRTVRTEAETGLEPVRQSTRIWMLVGPQPGFELAAANVNNAASSPHGPAVRTISVEPAELPDDPLWLDGVSALVVKPGDLTHTQAGAVRRWVERGGHLVVTAGSEAEAFQSDPLHEWLPIKAVRSYLERQTAALMSRITAFVPNAVTLRTLDDLRLTELRLADGVALISGPTAPVAARAAVGFGHATVVAADLDRPPFVRRPDAGSEEEDAAAIEALWDGLPRLCLILTGEPGHELSASGESRELRLSPTGVNDLQTQLASILDHFPEVQRPSSWNVIGLLSAYLLLIGPIDWFLVHRVLKRPQLTWLTLPVWVALASWWSTSYAAQSNGEFVGRKQLELVDVAVDTGLVRTHSWLSIYSPETRRHTIEVAAVSGAVESSTGAADALLGWLPRPEEGFRGMYRRGGLDLGGAGYRIEPRESRVAGMPVEVWSSLGVETTAERASPGDEPLAVTVQRVGAGGRVLSWTFRHNLPGEISDWFVVHEAQARFPLGEESTIRPGESMDLEQGLGQQLLRTFIQGELSSSVTTKTGTQTYVRSEEYDPLSYDSRRMFRTLTFHEAVGGSSYTRLSNQTLDRLDLSDLSHLDRMVLFGHLESPAVRYTVDGEAADPEGQETWVRIVVPIERERVEAEPEEE